MLLPVLLEFGIFLFDFLTSTVWNLEFINWNFLFFLNKKGVLKIFRNAFLKY
ncbi:hypothetical protein SAMN05444387_3897 [Flavobacterium pectinovorum]|uniref:Uncharacterized protein n=1 Tax=Flavobacterium pectinovorum TaxID=29533 RepID=A0ABY1J7Q6_9FLAO|nr:hypothetical protein SAMN05444387_3897 [Flavobacterium pectinovorum]